MISIDEFEFGTKVKILNKLQRSSEYNRNELIGITRSVRRFWKIIDIDKEGILIGKRTLNNGYRRGYSDHIEYSPRDYFDAYLVVTDMNTNPFYTTQIEKLWL